MAKLELKYPLDALFKGIPGDSFPKGSKIVVPKDHVCIVVQYGKVVGSCEGDAVLSKKSFPFLEAPFFGKVNCKIFVFPKAFNKSCFAKKHAFSLKDGKGAEFTAVVGYNVKLASPDRITSLLERAHTKEVDPLGVFLSEKDLGFLVKDWIVEFLRNRAEKGENWQSKKSYETENERKENAEKTLELEMNLKVFLQSIFSDFGYNSSVTVEFDDVCYKN